MKKNFYLQQDQKNKTLEKNSKGMQDPYAENGLGKKTLLKS